jgi:hypothetical protein
MAGAGLLALATMTIGCGAEQAQIDRDGDGLVGPTAVQPPATSTVPSPSASPAPTPTPAPSPTPSPAATPAPTPSATPVPTPSATPTPAPSPTPTPVSVTVAYTQDIKPILDANCIRCHSAMTSYSGVMRYVVPGSASSPIVVMTSPSGAMYGHLGSNAAAKSDLIRRWVVDDKAAQSR